MNNEVITLSRAMAILATVHTTAHDYSGYVVHDADLHKHFFTLSEYIAAWKTVRQSLGLEVEPKT
jgi:hypothetical protein